MKPGRIVLFALLLLVLRSLVAVVYPDAANGADNVALAKAGLVQYVVEGILIAVVFAVLARLQERAAYAAALLVVVVEEFIAWLCLALIGLFVELGDLSSPLWFLDAVALIVPAVIGTEIGRQWRRRRGVSRV